MLVWLRRRFQGRTAKPRIELTVDGFAAVAPDGRRSQVRWAAIARIAAYKRDRVTTDQIILAVELADEPGVIQEFSEEWEGIQRAIRLAGGAPRRSTAVVHGRNGTCVRAEVSRTVRATAIAREGMKDDGIKGPLHPSAFAYRLDDVLYSIEYLAHLG
jgi:hypothetical protein